jgi:hypothetical protein
MSDEAVAAAAKKHLLREWSYVQLGEEVKTGLCARKALMSVSFPLGKSGPASSAK